MVTLRAVETKDELFIEKVYRSTREKELSLTNWTEEEKNIFAISQLFAQLADYRANYKDASYQVILFNKKPAGRLYLYESVTEIKVIDISLLPEFQGKGIGRGILTGIISKARQKGLTVCLHVAKGNPAKRLYESLGFTLISQTNTHEYMECKPGAGKPI